MKLNQKGFTIVEILLVVIALTLIGGVGYYVYDRQSQKDKDNSIKVENKEEVKEKIKAQEPEKSKIPEGWKEYKNQELGFSFAYPQKWGDIKVEPLSWEHNGNGYKVSFPAAKLEGIAVSEDYKFTGGGRGGIYWEVYGGSYAALSTQTKESAEKAKAGDGYTTKILSQSEKHVASAYHDCMFGGTVTELLAKAGSKQISLLKLAKMNGDGSLVYDCPTSIPSGSVDQELANEFKQLPATLKTF